MKNWVTTNISKPFFLQLYFIRKKMALPRLKSIATQQNLDDLKTEVTESVPWTTHHIIWMGYDMGNTVVKSFFEVSANPMYCILFIDFAKNNAHVEVNAYRMVRAQIKAILQELKKQSK